MGNYFLFIKYYSHLDKNKITKKKTNLFLFLIKLNEPKKLYLKQQIKKI